MCKYSLTGLYLLTDEQLLPTDDLLLAGVEAALKGGAQIIQYRDKSNDQTKRLGQAKALVDLCANFHVPLLINDDCQLAKDSKAAGVHLGRNDGEINSARALLGNNAIIGSSCYADLDRAKQAAQAGADYIAYGAFYPSQTKPNAPRAPLELLHESQQKLNLPIVAIGGINHHNATQTLEAGAQMLAVVQAVLGAEDIEQEARLFSQLFNTQEIKN